MWKRYDLDMDGLIQATEMGAFLQEYWGFNPGEWAIKYWEGINALDKGYQGISPKDFVDCWISFDE